MNTLFQINAAPCGNQVGAARPVGAAGEILGRHSGRHSGRYVGRITTLLALSLGATAVATAYAQEIPAPPRALLEHQTRASQWERQQEQIRREAEITRQRTELLRAQQELRALNEAGQESEELPGMVAVFSVDGMRVAMIGHAGGAQWSVQTGDILPSGHRVERIQADSVSVVKGEGRNLKRTVLRPLVQPTEQPAAASGAAMPFGGGMPPSFGAPMMPPSMPAFTPGIMPPGAMPAPPPPSPGASMPPPAVMPAPTGMR